MQCIPQKLGSHPARPSSSLPSTPRSFILVTNAKAFGIPLPGPKRKLRWQHRSSGNHAQRAGGGGKPRLEHSFLLCSSLHSAPAPACWPLRQSVVVLPGVAGGSAGFVPCKNPTPCYETTVWAVPALRTTLTIMTPG